MVARMRLERAANLLRTVPKLSITAAAMEVGFSSAPVFSRAFKKHFGVSARQWDRKGPLEKSNNGQFRDEFPRYNIDELESFGFTVKIRSLPKQRLAYIRVDNAYSSFDRRTPVLYCTLQDDNIIGKVPDYYQSSHFPMAAHSTIPERGASFHSRSIHPRSYTISTSIQCFKRGILGGIIKLVRVNFRRRIRPFPLDRLYQGFVTCNFFRVT